MGIYVYGITDIVTAADGRSIGLLRYVGKCNPASAYARLDLSMAQENARNLSRFTIGRFNDRRARAPSLVAFESQWRTERTGGLPAPLYRWSARRLSYCDGGRPLRPA